MEDMRLGLVEARFADIVWESAPLTSKELVELCAKAPLNWKRTTTYTVLKRLCDRGLFAMENATVTVCIDKESFSTLRSQQFVNNHYAGSLPAFIAAFTARQNLSEQDIAEIRKLIDSYEG